MFETVRTYLPAAVVVAVCVQQVALFAAQVEFPVMAGCLTVTGVVGAVLCWAVD